MDQQMLIGLRRQIRLGTLLWQAFGARRGWRSYWLDVAYDVLEKQPIQQRKPSAKEEARGEVEGIEGVLFTL